MKKIKKLLTIGLAVLLMLGMSVSLVRAFIKYYCNIKKERQSKRIALCF